MNTTPRHIPAAALALAAAAAFAQDPATQPETKDAPMNDKLQLAQEWDKVFPLSDKVSHRKVTFETQYGLTLAADLYVPKDAEGKLPALAVRDRTSVV